MHHIVEPGFKKLEKNLAGHSAFAQSELEIAAELSFKNTILISKLLLFGQSECVVGQLTPGSLGSVLTGRIVLVFERLWGSVNEQRRSVGLLWFWVRYIEP